jgi:hypothetical protein
MTKQRFKLKREANARFGFSFLYPVGWKRFEPTNADGVRLTAPENHHVQILGFGRFQVAASLPEGAVSSTSLLNSQPDRVRLISDAPTTIENASGETKPAVARKVIFQREVDGAVIKTLEVIAEVGDVEVCVRCEAPLEDFPAFEKLFSDVIQSLRVYDASK